MAGSASGRTALLALWAAAAGCVGGALVPDSLQGRWGGEHVALEVGPDRATLEYDCAHGSIDEPLRPAGSGRFSARGTHVVEHGGPVREGEVPERHPAVYEGTVRGGEMTLSVTLSDTGRRLGPFRLRRGEPPLLFRCL